jgi:L-aminopeptidase/D-esterase-like protein
MVYNTTKMVMLPHHRCCNLHALSAQGKGMKFIGGSGMGSVLLKGPGGSGGASSYMDMDDYISTTGINPYTRAGVSQSKGSGIPKSITSKLSKLSIAPPPTGPKRKNIVMSF